MTAGARPAASGVAAGGRGHRTRRAIQEAALKLFAAHPVDAVAIDDIVREAKVAKGSFYTHFDTKDALVTSLVADIRSIVEALVEAANAGVSDPASRVARAICIFARFALDHPERALVLAHNDDERMPLSAPLNRGVVEDISAGLAAERFLIPTVDAGVAMVSGVTRILMLRAAQERSEPAALNLAQQLGAMLLRGLGVPWDAAGPIAALSADLAIRQGCLRAPADGREEAS